MPATRLWIRGTPMLGSIAFVRFWSPRNHYHCCPPVRIDLYTTKLSGARPAWCRQEVPLEQENLVPYHGDESIIAIESARGEIARVLIPSLQCAAGVHDRRDVFSSDGREGGEGVVVLVERPNEDTLRPRRLAKSILAWKVSRSSKLIPTVFISELTCGGQRKGTKVPTKFF